ncbi:TPA_asm: hypothetical protein G3V02_004847, partial [Salmonella enterica subsp. enterica serovar Ank]|nr:hypothetical protein [Salmonella enterica subsp. enterica serovar Ank]
MTLNNATVTSTEGNVGLRSRWGALNLTGGNVNAAGDITLRASGTNAGVATLNNAVLNSTGGKVSASAEGGALSMNGGSVTAADDIALSASGDTTLQATINSSAGNVSVASGGNITVQNATISSGEHHDISILGAGSTTGLVQILNST